MNRKMIIAALTAALILSGCNADFRSGTNKDPVADPVNIAGTSAPVTEAETPAEEIVSDLTEPETPAEETVSDLTEPETPAEEIVSDLTEPETPAEETVSDLTEPEKPASQTAEAVQESEVVAIKDYMFSDEDDFFFIVNKQYLLPDDYEIKTDYVQKSYEMEVTAAKYCRDMIEAARLDGIELKVLSAYRTVSYQKKLFERNVKSRMENDGMSYEEAYYDTSINIAPPGGSEHNAGLGVDIITKKDWDTYTGFEKTKEFAWLQEHAHEYGFILRYLRGKEEITGYIYEPWHYRYIGTKYAKDIRDSGLCLEEYFEQYVWVDGKEPWFPWED